jgi:hypothetical protein
MYNFNKRINLIKQFSLGTFIRSTIFFILLTIVSYFYAGAIDEHVSLSVTKQVIAKLFYVLRYPSWLLFYDGMPAFVPISGFLINCLIYALLIERMIYLLFRKKKLKQQDRLPS